jgi:hypothetical protein
MENTPDSLRDFDRIRRLAVVGRLSAGGGDRGRRRMLEADGDIQALVEELCGDRHRFSALASRIPEEGRSAKSGHSRIEEGVMFAARFMIAEVEARRGFDGRGSGKPSSHEGAGRHEHPRYMRTIKTVVGVVLFLAGGGLVLLELGMAISESHAIDDLEDIALIAFVVILGAGVAFAGYLLQRQPQ